MTIIDISPSSTYKLLKKIKKTMKDTNPLFKINNDVVIHHALKKIEEGKDYEIKLFD